MSLPTDGAMAGEHHTPESHPPGILLVSTRPAQFAREQINQFVAQLEVPFDPIVIE